MTYHIRLTRLPKTENHILVIIVRLRKAVFNTVSLPVALCALMSMEKGNLIGLS